MFVRKTIAVATVASGVSVAVWGGVVAGTPAHASPIYCGWRVVSENQYCAGNGVVCYYWDQNCPRDQRRYRPNLNS